MNAGISINIRPSSHSETESANPMYFKQDMILLLCARFQKNRWTNLNARGGIFLVFDRLPLSDQKKFLFRLAYAWHNQFFNISPSLGTGFNRLNFSFSLLFQIFKKGFGVSRSQGISTQSKNHFCVLCLQIISFQNTQKGRKNVVPTESYIL